MSTIHPSVKSDSMHDATICFSPRSASSVRGTMCFISAKLRLPLRVQNIFNSSDLYLAEVTERAIMQNASRPPLRLHTGRGALSYSCDTIAHNVPDTPNHEFLSRILACLQQVLVLFFPCHSSPIQSLTDFCQG